MSGATTPASIHSFRRVSASTSAHAPSSQITPVSSAIEMNAPGGTISPPARRHLMSDSNPLTLPSASSMIGWWNSVISRRPIAPCSACSRSMRLATLACIESSNTAVRLAPSSLAWWLATSARRSSSSADVARFSGAIATPMLVLTGTVVSSMTIGSASALRISSTRRIASSRLRVDPSTMTKSSPPNRPTSASSGSAVVSRRRAIAASTRFAPWWPSESLMCLKRSMLRCRTVGRHSVRQVWSRQSSTSPTKRVRVGSPVRSSMLMRRCSAARTSSCSAEAIARRATTRAIISAVPMPRASRSVVPDGAVVPIRVTDTSTETPMMTSRGLDTELRRSTCLPRSSWWNCSCDIAANMKPPAREYATSGTIGLALGVSATSSRRVTIAPTVSDTAASAPSASRGSGASRRSTDRS